MTKGQAKQALEALLRPLNEGVYSPVQRMTFGAFCDRCEKEILTHYRAGPVVFRFLADLRASECNRGEYVFTTTAGTLFASDSNVRNRVFNPCAEAVKMSRFSFRSFRRTAATFIHNSGAPLKVQREIMGHTEEEMSLVYSEAEVGLQRKTLDRGT
jgi:integrase